MTASFKKTWQHDLYANAARTGRKGAIAGWFMNPGFAAVTLFRVSRWGYCRGGFVGRAVQALAWHRIAKRYGCYISPTAIIGSGLRLPHPVGIVIGENSIIGDGCTLYQGVTLGRHDEESKCYPVLGRSVVVYAGATLAGGVKIGDCSAIGAHAVVLADVPPDSVAAGVPARVRLRR
jgi:serine O-acetyltransferase